MNVIKHERKLCPCCMKVHDVQTVVREEVTTYNGKEVKYQATYEYCAEEDALFTVESMASKNDAAMKAAYQKRYSKSDRTAE